MISILIPTYNYDCTRLVAELSRQGQALMDGNDTFAYEVLVGDDASTDKQMLEVNRAINGMPHCRLVAFSQNLGRAAIRNQLADMARYPYLIFMDCDAQICSDNFLQRYAACVGNDVVVGGLFNVPEVPSPAFSLRYRYEEAAQERWLADHRRQAPYESFATFNFMIRKTVFQAIRFDERCRRYGYEDTLFGIELERRGIPILHIENRLIHLGLETNDVFLKKTETALQTLASLDCDIQRKIRISRVAGTIERLRLAPLCRMLHSLVGRWEKKHLCGKNPDLFIFNLYKLGYYLSLRNSVRSEKTV